MRRQTSTWVWVVGLLAGAIVGSVIGEALSGLVPLLAKGFAIGIQPPFHVDLNVISLTLGFTVHLNMAGAILVLILVLFFGR
ncbi:MAG TPA: DUF4321 domain-containing protein [Bacillota bacterium]|nr:DUF4321 domain-containing protein [Candidatus Fermentithermobacillaceae bacterium]HOB30211.1 DUF4321 domain-containing protein [Bacillota bacterium]HOK64180.1 DUF4321 domain-containing protein [Bacillota bacterium]HOL11689.1 DUF4321 domain-containing protein [Bacillota bacterium]HOQ02817.1 DUF4321 domain-containing protein [Bacillota bacterium]